MNVQRDYDLASPVLRLCLWLLILAFVMLLAFPQSVEAQGGNFCTASGGSRTEATTLDPEASFLVMNEACPGTPGQQYERIEWASVLLLTGRVTTHATDCTGTTAISPALCYERDADTLYGCDLAAGSTCDEAGDWTEITGGGGGLESVAPADMDDDDFGDWTCATGVCTLDADVVAPAEMADADHGAFTYATGVATIDNGAVGDAALAAGAVDGGNGGEIADGSITADDLATDSVAADEIAASAVGTSEINDGTVAAGDLGTDSVSADELNATGVESELEAALEVGQLQGGLAADQVDTITDIAAALKSGSDVTLVTGTEGAADDCAKWNADGDLVSAGAACGTPAGDVTDVFNCSSGDCASIALADGDLLDASAVNASGTSEGIKLPQATSCASATAEGQICWDTNDDDLYVGDGAAAQQMNGTGGGGSALMGGGTIGNLATGATRYFSISGIQAPTATSADAVFLIPVNITVTRFECKTSASPDNGGGTQSYVFNLRDIGGAATTETCTISEANANCSDTSGHSFGSPSTIAVEVVPSGTPTARTAQCTMVYSVD